MDKVCETGKKLSWLKNDGQIYFMNNTHNTGNKMLKVLLQQWRGNFGELAKIFHKIKTMFSLFSSFSFHPNYKIQPKF